ncbi:Protein ANTAGONIST OF LIKE HETEROCHROMATIN PROTEIN 1 [Amphibalanus amphitrite]|uniref:Protein ANTAGONIST OF LIKE HETEROCHROMATIN PROTEIN 1 n=1 Tax=Amphibalanus amphitrite TaxID=1232801 RepID=A0A6A4W5G7_AMPAM|nr:Protein ANTAGONIST OF LIKE HETEROCHROMATIN PROTEIN 1 [Amphibalanus amphitrite]
MWVRQPVLRRQEMGEFRALMAQERENGSAFHNAYRMSPEAFDELTVQLEPALRRQDTNFRLAITPAEKLALTIRYLASGMSQKDVARYFRLGRATVSKAIPEVCQAIWNIIGPIELPPLTEESWLEDAAEFERRWNFPHCLGAIDGKHIAIQKPGLSGSAFYNYKGGCSVLLMAVADADYRFKDGVSNDRRYIEVNDVDHDDRDGNVVPGPWRAHGEAMGLRDAGRLAANTYTRAAASARDKFAE